MRILYVEDEAVVREQITMIFDILFEYIDVAYNGEEAWEKYQNSQYDIIFTDISMPKMDGLELSERIKQDNPMQKIIIISAYNISNYLLNAIELGVDGFLLKPIKMDKVLFTIQKVADSITSNKIMKNYRKKLEEEVDKKTKFIQEQAVTDILTGLQNRFALQKVLEKSSSNKALLLLDVDNFDSINVVHGYDYGDKVILFLSQLLVKNKRANSDLFYLGNDEFAITCNALTALEFAQDLQKTIADSIVKLPDNNIRFTVTIAIAKESQTLLKHAYIALKEAKEQGGNTLKIYSKDLRIEKLQAQIQKYSPIIRNALAHNHVIPYFQPIVDNRTKKIYKYECLARIVDENRLYSPFEFIDIAQTIGVIPEITKIMIDKSFKVFQKNDYMFSINITEFDLNSNYLKKYFSDKLLEHRVDPSRVILEVLEGISIIGAKNSLKQLIELKEMGFNIAIDDFGAENSNFGRVHSMNVDFIKIDGSFVKNIDTNAKSYSIVKTINDFAKSIGAEVIAEYVHSQKVQNIVQNLGIEYSQGYYFCEPRKELCDEDI